MTVRFFMDVHIPRAVTLALRVCGIDVLTAQEDGSARWPDDQLLLRAHELGRVMVSQDSDMLREGSRLRREGQSFSGIVYAHQLGISIGQFVEALALIAGATEAEEWKGRIDYIP